MADAKRDSNYIPTLLAVSSVDGSTPVTLYADPTTHRLYVDLPGSSGTVTSVGFTGGLISVATPTTTPAFTVAGTSGGIPYFSSASTWASSAALAANSLVVGGGAGVAPSTVTTGTGVLTALAINVGSAGAFVTFNGALGTPSSGTLTNATGLPIAGLVASTSTAIGVGSIELGHASDTTLSRSSAGVLAVEGVTVSMNSTSATHTAGTIELGAASDTTIARVSAGVISVEGKTIATLTDGGTFAADISVPDEAYGVGWNGSVEVPTKNAIYDKIETLGGGSPGWEFVSYNTATNSASITISSLNLATDLCYKIVFQSLADSGTNDTITMTVNGTGIGTHYYVGQWLMREGSTTSGTFGSSADGSWKLGSENNKTHHGDLILSLGDADGSYPVAVMGGDVMSFGVATRIIKNDVAGGVNMTTTTGFTLTASGGTPNWKVWVFKAATS